MSNPTSILDGARVLILEDDYYLATDLQRAMEEAGAVVIGPFSREADVGPSLGSDRPDCAFIDINLGGGPSFEVPRELMRIDVPFAIVTGYDEDTIPSEFAVVRKFEKPIHARMAVDVARQLLGRGAATAR